MIVRLPDFLKYYLELLGIIIFRILLDINYVVIVSPYYAYAGLVNKVTFLSYLVSWVVFLIPARFILKQYTSKYTFFANVIVLLFLMAFVPGTSLMAFMPMDFTFFVLWTTYWFLIFFFSHSLKPIKAMVLPSTITKYALYGFLAVFVGTVLYISWKYTGFRFHPLLSNVYGIRHEATKWNMPIVFSYLLSAANNILPLLLIYFLYRKKNIIVILIGIIIYLNFSK